jgi:hypothetical protein
MAARRAHTILLGFSLLGCVTAPEHEVLDLYGDEVVELDSSAGLASVRISLNGDRLQRGSNSLNVSVVPREASAPVALVGASALMPAHGHSSGRPVLVPVADHYRIDDLVLYMPGRWDVRLDFEIAGEPDESEFSLEVP